MATQLKLNNEINCDYVVDVNKDVKMVLIIVKQKINFVRTPGNI